MNLKKFNYIYVFIDFASAVVTWIIFYLNQVNIIGISLFGSPVTQFGRYQFTMSLFLIPLFWLLIYKSSGYYNQALRKFHVEDIVNTFAQTLLGVTALTFITMIYNSQISISKYIYLYIFLLVLHFLLTVIPRYLFTSYVIHLKKVGKVYFKALFVGRKELIFQMWQELNKKSFIHGNRFFGYIPVENNIDMENEIRSLTKVGEVNDLFNVVTKNQIDDVIIVLNENDVDIYKKVLRQLNGSDVVIKINAELYPLLEGRRDVSSLFHYPLIQIKRSSITPFKLSIKRIIDICASLFGLTITLPITCILIFIIKMTSKGPLIYSQERIGRNGKPFRIFKFRSMYQNAEVCGPQLATKNDARITRIGSLMRRLRLDEIPNFVNVLIGDMSLVGPRPERKFYIDQIVERAPEYRRLMQVKPGVTSWGQVKYGYAESIDEMIKRMRYDLLYIENMSMYVDLQILIRTIFIIIQGRGV